MRVVRISRPKTQMQLSRANTGSSIRKSFIQSSVLETFNDILKLSLVFFHPVGWAILLLGKKFDIEAQFMIKNGYSDLYCFQEISDLRGFSTFLSKVLRPYLI